MRILIIEDDEKQCMILKFRLEKDGYNTDLCYDGEDAEYYLDQNIYDLILLDRMLPHKDGLTILKEIRSKSNNTPIILLTALGSLDDKITGLDSGADDYIVKPFEYGELLARIRCLLRRPRHIENPELIAVGDITFWQMENKLQGADGVCTLSPKESSLLTLFLNNADQTLTRNTILKKIWGTDYEIEEGNLDNYVYFIRRRLKAVGSNMHIRTIRGTGYILLSEVQHNDNGV